MTYKISDRDRHGWQRQAVVALVAMLTHGYSEGLPALHWSIATTGTLIGEAHGLGVGVVEQRAAFDAWADYLNADRWQERTDADGTTHLHAVFTWRQNDRVKGAIRAVVFAATDDSAPA
ncbi:hypothetical protein [Streptomyces sp. NBC_01198]|uniref:hypothetical protein n=1 Tax=Streptomyces sp. NBC_01198 TaxID=2903769 RepID=UPI002E13C0B5|nr:hypothetical protein OG702_22790 [Streptomyces sp. NBC_01198]